MCSRSKVSSSASLMPGSVVSLRCLVVLLSVLPSVHCTWWYLGVLSSTGTTRDTRQVAGVAGNEAPPPTTKCSNSPYLEPRQRELCSKEDQLVNVISRGAAMGIDECKFQFQNRRWNCSTFNRTDVFGNILKRKSRETAYIYAISSAGIMHSITRACAKGELDGCGCDETVRKKDNKGKFEWGGCSENLRYGEGFAEEFVDSREETLSESGLMNLWNNEAGRKAAKKEVELVCKCHGVSGSCSVKICWRKMKQFREVGSALKDRFDGASLVKLNKRKQRLKAISKDMKRPTKKDLVYLEESPDFCNPDPRHGSLGTKGRRCNKDSYGLDGCNLMCCGRGYYTIVKEFVEDCDCKFFWCCRVECKKCSHVKELHFCN